MVVLPLLLLLTPLLPPPSPSPFPLRTIVLHGLHKNIHDIGGNWFLGKLFFGVLWEIEVSDFPTVECFRAVFDYIP